MGPDIQDGFNKRRVSADTRFFFDGACFLFFRPDPASRQVLEGLLLEAVGAGYAMPDDVDPNLRDADAENNSKDAPPARPVPLQERDRMDTGCLLLLMAGFVGIFFIPAVFLLGGAPAIIPLITLLLVAMVTPFINPTEKMSAQARWTGRLITFLGLALILVVAWYFIFMRETPLLRE